MTIKDTSSAQTDLSVKADDKPPTPPPPSPGKEIPPAPQHTGRTVAMPEEDVKVLLDMAGTLKQFPGAIHRLEQQINEVRKERSFAANDDYADIPPPRSGPDDDDETAEITRDFKRLSTDFLDTQDSYTVLPDALKREFDEEWQLRCSHVLAGAVKENRLVNTRELKSAFERTFKAVAPAPNDAQAIEAARAAGQMDIINRDSGNVGNTSSRAPASSDISSYAYSVADRSLLVKEGKITREEMAKRVQAKIERGEISIPSE